MADEFREDPSPIVPKELTPSRKQFLDTQYLQAAYLIPPEIKSTLEELTADLIQRFPELVSLTVVGGVANGSYMLRQSENPKTVTDLDFYLVGHSTSPKRLAQIANEVFKVTAKLGI